MHSRWCWSVQSYFWVHAKVYRFILKNQQVTYWACLENWSPILPSAAIEYFWGRVSTWQPTVWWSAIRLHTIWWDILNRHSIRSICCNLWNSSLYFGMARLLGRRWERSFLCPGGRRIGSCGPRSVRLHRLVDFWFGRGGRWCDRLRSSGGGPWGWRKGSRKRSVGTISSWILVYSICRRYWEGASCIHGKWHHKQPTKWGW